MREYQSLLVEQQGAIAHVMINRPAKANSMDEAFWTEMVEVFDWVDRTDSVRVAVISGVGRNFSAGIDLQMLAQAAGSMVADIGRNAERIRRNILKLQSAFNAVDECRKPVIAAVHRSEEHTSELQSRPHLVCRLLLEKKKIILEIYYSQ